MLEVFGKKADNIQSSLLFLFIDTKELLNYVNQYSFINSDDGWNEIDNTDFFKKHTQSLSAVIIALRSEIIIGIAKIIDNDPKCVTLYKLFNQLEQTKEFRYKIVIKKYLKEIEKYESLFNYIKTARNKIFSHTDYSFNANKIDKYSEYLLEKEILKDLELFLKLVMNICVEISKMYDNDMMMLEYKKNIVFSIKNF